MSTKPVTNTESKPPERPSRRHHMRLAIGVLAAVALVMAVVVVVKSTTSHAATINCAPAPSSCGYPDATNTGVPKGMVLKKVPSQVTSGPGWHYDPRGWVEVYGGGAVLSGLYIPYNLDISASNVTIKDVQVVSGGPNAFGISVRHANNVTIEDSTITGLNTTNGRMMTGVKDVYADSTGLTVLRDNISMTETGVQLESGLVQDCYIHNTGFITGDHVNGITSNGGNTALLTIKHNTIMVNRNQTDAVGLFEDFGVQANRVITGNLLAGGSYAIYGGQNPGGAPTSNITVTNNAISTMYYPTGGSYGPVAYFNSAGTGDIWSGNTWDSSGKALTAP